MDGICGAGSRARGVLLAFSFAPAVNDINPSGVCGKERLVGQAGSEFRDVEGPVEGSPVNLRRIPRGWPTAYSASRLHRRGAPSNRGSRQ